jgi:outer membrane lipoprotein LolB
MSVLLLFIGSSPIASFRGKAVFPVLPKTDPQPPGRAKRLLAVLLMGLLSACQNLAPPAGETDSWTQLRRQLQGLESWQLRGRVNIRYQQESHTPRIQWQQQQERYHIRLWGTFNAGNTEINGRPGWVSLEQDGEVLTANTPEQLILDQLGYELPVSYLEYWIKGIPAPASSADLQFNELNQLAGMTQDGWTVEYSDMRQYAELSLPRRVDVSRPRDDVRLRFVGLDWNLDALDLEPRGPETSAQQ